MALVVENQKHIGAAGLEAGAQAGTVEKTWTGPRSRSAQDFASAERHSRRVKRLKLGLPLAALFIVGFFSAATILSDSSKVEADATPVAMSDGRIVMANPKMEGFTSEKRPYKMVAERAIQESAKATSITLEKITADMPFGKEATASMKAGSGVFDNVANKLELRDAITLVTSDGMTASLSSARIDMASNAMVSDEPVDIQLRGSHITADRISVTEGGKIVTFENRVRLKIEPNKLKQAAGDLSAAEGQ